ncbi:unnamed protein product, partial [Pocillopora meandrina]
MAEHKLAYVERYVKFGHEHENTASKTSTLLFHLENSISGDLIIIVRAVGTYLHSCQQTTYSATSEVSH